MIWSQRAIFVSSVEYMIWQQKELTAERCLFVYSPPCPPRLRRWRYQTLSSSLLHLFGYQKPLTLLWWGTRWRTLLGWRERPSAEWTDVSSCRFFGSLVYRGGSELGGGGGGGGGDACSQVGSNRHLVLTFFCGQVLPAFIFLFTSHKHSINYLLLLISRGKREVWTWT